MENTNKILIVDDSEPIHKTIRHMLKHAENLKTSVFSAFNGQQAIDIASIEHPDIILMDIQMPEMDGIEATKRIKSEPALSEIPILLMSSTRSFADAFAAGADDFILKPINQYEMLLRVALNIKFAQKSKEIKQKTEQLNLQNQEVICQRDKIVTQQNEMLKDLQYASYIQSAIMPEIVHLEEYLKKFFIYNKPKDIVSGDFYWATQRDNLVIIAVGDCTGHGIAGALMTMAGIAFLDEIVKNNCIVQPDIVLNELRSRVIKLLNQKGKIGEASNGMDISLCTINIDEGIVQYAGANNPIYLIRNKEKLEIIKADRMPIGIHINHLRPFTMKELFVNKGDSLYLFTDGYADQFGGPAGQKFRYNQFQELILSASKYPIKQQEKLFDATMRKWKGKIEQLDDILILGIEF